MRIYTDRAAYYDAIYHWKTYEEDAACLRDLLHGEGIADGATVLEAACGTGQYLRHLDRWYDVAGFDLNAGILEVARARLPGAHLFEADMTDFAVEQPVDALLCLFSSIGYVYPQARLEAAASCFHAALRPGGVLVIEPWIDPAEFTDGHTHLDTSSADNLKLCRASTSTRRGDLAVIDFHWLALRPGEPIEHFTERHELWLCPHADLLTTFTAAGFTCRLAHPPHLQKRGLIIARRKS